MRLGRLLCWFGIHVWWSEEAVYPYNRCLRCGKEVAP